MRRHVLLIFFIFFCFINFSHAQKEILSVDLGSADLKDFTVSETGDGLLLYQIKDCTQQFFFYSYKGKEFIEKKIPVPNCSRQYLQNIFIRDSSVVYLFFDNTGGVSIRYYTITVSTKDGDAVRSETAVFGNTNDDKILASWQIDSTGYFLVADKHSSILNLESFTAGSGLHKTALISEIKNIYKQLTRHALTVNNPDVENSIYLSSYQYKVFPGSQQAIIAIDGADLAHENTTDVYVIDLVTGKVTLKSFTEELPAAGVINSFYFDEKIFRLTLGEKVFRLTIYDLTTEKALKKFEFHVRDYFDLMQTDYKKISGPDPGVKQSFENDGTPGVLRKILSGNPGICINQFAENTFQLTIGKYSEEKSTRDVVTTFMFGSLVAGLINVWSGDEWINAPVNYQMGPGTSVYFECTLEIPDYNISKNVSHSLLIERIKFFEENLKKESDLKLGYRALYTFEDKIHFAFIPKHSAILHIFEFEK